MAESTSKRKTKTGLCILVSVLVLFLIFICSLRFAMRKNQISILHGKVIITEYDNNGSFCVDTARGLYRDTSFTLDSANEKFSTDIQLGDSAYVICKEFPQEIGPKNFDIYYMFKSPW